MNESALQREHFRVSEEWKQFRRKCGELAPDLGRVQDILKAISVDEHDPDPAFTVQAVTEELHSILDELKDSLKPKELSRYTDELM
jgi:hypothetical protein